MEQLCDLLCQLNKHSKDSIMFQINEGDKKEDSSAAQVRIFHFFIRH